MLRALSLAWSLGLAPAETPSDDASVAAPPPEPSAAPAEAPDGGFFDPEIEGDAVPAPTDEPASEASPSTSEADVAPESDVAAPPMPEVEEIPTHDEPPARRKLFDRSPDPARDPAGSQGGSFFDPGRLEDTGPAGGLLQIRGYVAANFFVATRSNTARRGPDGTFPDLKPMPFFDVSSAALYVGAPIWTDVIYARISLEFVSLPQTQVTTAQPDIIAQANRRLFFEAAALEVNPFAWAKKTDRWFREGFKITGGVFIVPFGREDEEHASPANWFVSRPRSMTSNRVYPGTWSDVGVSLKWKPTFRERSPVRPIEIDVGVWNGDPCTQTRFLASLYEPNVTVPACSRRRRPGELGASGLDPEPVPINSGFFGFSSDNNINKTFSGRVRIFPVPAADVGGSFVIGKHPETTLPAAGETTAELGQALSWRAGGHVELLFDEMFESRVPLPLVRGEIVTGVDHAVDEREHADRTVLGGYVQIAQMLFRRKKTRLPGLFLQYRFDHADPDLNLPGVVNGVPVAVDQSSFDYRGETTLQGHTVGLRFPALPRFSLKAEYTFMLEDGGRENRAKNDLFAFEAVVDF
jgi:hypothetical protein